MVIEQGLWRLNLILADGTREERYLPHEQAVEDKDFAICCRPEVISGSLTPPKRIIIRGLARIPQASRTQTPGQPKGGPRTKGPSIMKKQTLTGVVAAIEAGEQVEQPIGMTLAEAQAEEKAAKKGGSRKSATPRVPDASDRKKARDRKEKKAAEPKPESDARKAELAAIKARLESKMPALDPALLGPGQSYSRDIRLIASSRVPRICSKTGKAVPVGSPLIQWTSNQPGNEKGYMFRSEEGMPTAQDLMNDARSTAPKAPRAKGVTLADLQAGLATAKELGADPSSLGSVKVSGATVEQIGAAMAKLGIESQAEFRRAAYAFFAQAVLAAS
jgi:hypothetical protein